MQQALQRVIATSFGTGAIKTPREIGLGFDGEGRLELDEAKLSAALGSNFNGVRSFFAGAGGFADTLRKVTDNAVDVVDGSLLARIEGTTDTINDIDDQIADAERRIERVEESLVRQFAALERTVSAIQIQGNFLAQFVLQSQNR
jgi:flagellar hook-associated protein 2